MLRAVARGRTSKDGKDSEYLSKGLAAAEGHDDRSVRRDQQAQHTAAGRRLTSSDCKVSACVYPARQKGSRQEDLILASLRAYHLSVLLRHSDDGDDVFIGDGVDTFLQRDHFDPMTGIPQLTAKAPKPAVRRGEGTVAQEAHRTRTVERWVGRDGSPGGTGQSSSRTGTRWARRRGC